MGIKNNVAYKRVNRHYASVFKDFCSRLGSVLDPTDQTGFVEASRSGNVDAIEFSPDAFTCPDSARDAYLLSEVIRKYQDFPGDSAKRTEKALSSFRKAEEQCLETNVRLSKDSAVKISTFTAASLIHTAARKIENLLGKFDLDEAASGFGFGPGATTRLPRSRSDAWYKFQGTPETTWNNATFAKAIMARWDLWSLSQHQGRGIPEGPLLPFTEVRGNRVVTVPKNAKTDRVIAIEPDLNTFVQQGIGAMIRRRLKHASVDLNDQTINQRLALRASLDDSGLATLDLSMASDTVSKGLVELLMPSDWLRYMDMCRSPYGVLPDGTEVLYRKYSSMGNSFTFELESLIFWAICSAVYDLRDENGSVLSVYGDDLIVTTRAYSDIVEALNYLGFSVNAKKSFSTGAFRESCGKHYFRGRDISPFYLRKKVTTPADVLLLANNLCRWSARGFHRDARVKPIYDWLVSLLPPSLSRNKIPDGYGDGGLIGDFDEVLPKKAPHGREGFLCRTVVTTQDSRWCHGSHALVKSLFRLEKRGSRDRIQLRGNEKTLSLIPTGYERYKDKNILVTRFPHLGPWF